MAKLAVIGSCSVDLVVEAARRPQAGETLFAEHFFMSCGGKGANQAVAAARLGADVAMIGAIGEDAYGKMLCENFVKNGVDARFLMTLPDVSTGTAHITLAEGDNSILVVPAANFRLTAAHIEQALDQLGELDMVLLQNEVPQDVTEDAIRLCAERNIPVLWNPAPARELALDVMAMCRYITPNDHELALLFDVADPLELSAEWQKKLIVTRGKDGVDYYDGKGVHRVAGESVTVVDTTGAGDTFNGAFAVAISEGQDLETALRFANHAAALSITAHGAQGAMPWRDEMEA